MTTDTISKTILSGLGEISRYVGRDKRTVLRWIQELSFPAKLMAGRWESDKLLVDEWRRKTITE